MALVKGEVEGKPDVLVRMHAENPLAETFASAEEPGGNLLAGAMQRIQSEAEGVIVYIHGDRTGDRLIERLRVMAERSQDPPRRPGPSPADPPGVRTESVPASGSSRGQVLRDYGIGAPNPARPGTRVCLALTQQPSPHCGAGWLCPGGHGAGPL